MDKEIISPDDTVLMRKFVGNNYVYKFKDKRVYLISIRGNYWMVTEGGVMTFDSEVRAFDVFFREGQNKEDMGFVRKSSHAKLRSKTAGMMKTAISYDNDAWISNPDDLSNVYSRSYWAITKSGKHAARLFNEKDFPLER